MKAAVGGRARWAEVLLGSHPSVGRRIAAAGGSR